MNEKEATYQNSQTVFSMAVEKKAQDMDGSLLEALSEIIEECQIDPREIVKRKLISNSLREKLEYECYEKRLIRREENTPSLF